MAQIAPALHPSPPIVPRRGFLPDEDPLIVLPDAFAAWEAFGRALPRRLLTGQVRRQLEALPELDTGSLEGPALRRAMLLLSYFGHAYVWGGAEPAARIPANLAVPWAAVAFRLGRPPVLSYASYALDNWRRIDPAGPVALGNLELLQNFYAGADEDWFILIHIDIEARACEVLLGAVDALAATDAGEPGAVEAALMQVGRGLEAMYATLERMPEYCDPYIYYRRVRPFIHGWKNHPALPHGVVYEGVERFGGEPQQLRGETGAQSAIVPSLDALLRVEHRNDPLRTYLMEMRDYMPPAHRAFIEWLERGPDVRAFCEAHGGTLSDAYDRCITGVRRFRGLHLEYASRYIHQQAQSGAGNPTQVGTGGTPFMPYLAKHRDETAAQRLKK